MAKRRRTGNRTFPKRATLWLPFDQSMSLVTAGTVVDSNDLLGNYFGQTGEEIPTGSTLGPIRGIQTLRPTGASTFDVGFGLEAVVQLLKEGGRATSPIPGVDIIDAMWYGQMTASQPGTESATGVFTQAIVEKPFESKAMRKVTGNGQILVVSAVPDSNTDYTYRVLGSILVRLP